MKMKCKLLSLNSKTNPITTTGKKLIDMIQDKSTPLIDLLVRESIQNSADAILDDKEYGTILFNHGKFNSNDFIEKLSGEGETLNIQEKMFESFKEEEYDYLTIRDVNTTGLLGEPVKVNNGYNNLHSLVYDIMDGKAEQVNAGGSWGLGKTVYFRMGVGLCFYYTRTFENNEFKEKLVGTLIVDQSKNDRIVSKETSGIGYLGKDSDDPEISFEVPITDHNEICEFIHIFNVDPYVNNQTGTTVIIPYFNKELLLESSINKSEEIYWKNNFEEALRIAIQRWYFPRINNDKYNGKFIKVRTNSGELVLNSLFDNMQKLYNGALYGAKTYNIEMSRTPNLKFGKFIYKQFTSDELGIGNFSPYYYLDIEFEEGKRTNPIVCYTRKPGMIVTYQDKNVIPDIPLEDKYVIGIFVLNDESSAYGITLGEYIRSSELANHNAWKDRNDEEDIQIKEMYKHKPFEKIRVGIKNELKANIIPAEEKIEKKENIFLQRKFGFLMPKEGFGTQPTPEIPNPPGPPKPNDPPIKPIRKTKAKVDFIENVDGLLCMCLSGKILKDNKVSIDLCVDLQGNKTKISEWIQEGFDMPCDFYKFIMTRYFIDGKTYKCEYLRLVENLNRGSIISVESKELFCVLLNRDKNSNRVLGFDIENISGQDTSVELFFYMKPTSIESQKYSIDFSITTNKIEESEDK